VVTPVAVRGLRKSPGAQDAVETRYLAPKRPLALSFARVQGGFLAVLSHVPGKGTGY